MKAKGKKESDELATGDAADDKEIEDEDDPEDDIVDDNGFSHQWLQTSAQLGKYSDELANGDSMDDRDIHEDEDMNDDVVDENGQTNWGYGSKLPSRFFAENHIRPGTHITEPRNVQLSDHNLLQLSESDDVSSDDTKAKKQSAGQIKPSQYWREIKEQSQARRSASKYL